MFKKLLFGLIIISNVCNINAMETQPQNIDQNNLDNFSNFIDSVVNKYDTDYNKIFPADKTSEIFTKYNCVNYNSNPLSNAAIADANCKTLYDVIILNLVENKIYNLFRKKLINQPIQIMEFKSEQITDSLLKTLNNTGHILTKYYNNIGSIKFIDNKLVLLPLLTTEFIF